jgi:hypothetical protein
MKITQEMPQGGSLSQVCRSCSTVCRGNHTQLGPLFVEFVPRRLQGCAGSGDIIPLFMATHPDSLDWMEGAEVFFFFH